jgi:hypothetical protein
MTAFQSLMATIYMLLAKARAPIDSPQVVPAPSRTDAQRTRRELSKASHLRAMPMRRRRTDWPSEHAPLVQRIWQSVKALGPRDRTGTRA